MAVLRVNSQTAALKVNILLGKDVDLAMEQEPLPHLGRIVVAERSLDEIPHEVADQQLFIVSGEVEVEKEVQSFALPTEKAMPSCGPTPW